MGVRKKKDKMFKCKYCGRKFNSKHGLHVHIGHNHLEKRKVNCDYCGKEIRICPFSMKRSKHHFCSRECYRKWRKEKTPTKICEQCGEEFKVKPSKKDKSRFCSKECFYKWRSENKRGKNNPNWKPKVTKTCEYCGKEFKVVPANKDARFCSIECKDKYRSEHPEEYNRKWREKILKSLMKKPTKPEQKFIELCKEFNLPYKYVGDGDFWIENMNPDFINVNGKKIAIEILGDYWHTEEGFKERKKKFKEYGWKCIGIWEHEIKKLSDKKIAKKIKKFL